MIDETNKDTLLVFLHGWGQSSQIWFQQKAYFSTHARYLDLPGHGFYQNVSATNWLDTLENQLLQLSNEHNIMLVGWSLGGQLALALEKKLHGKKIIKGLALVSSTPCFRQQPSWPHGCSDDVWQGFSQATEQKDPKLMQRFFQMMLHGDHLTRAARNHIAKESINKRTPPTFEGLEQGLSLLSELDSRSNLSNIDIPTLVIHGQQDIITPIPAGHFLAANIPRSQMHIVEDCGHAPFLTHHAEFNALLEQWWKKISV
ncbi:MAG: alpha/beta fold hydrolase [Ghiorsea sp.]